MRFCIVCWKAFATGALARHLKVHRDEDLPCSRAEASIRASKIAKGGIRPVHIGEVLKYFPDATEEFFKNLETLLRKAGDVLVTSHPSGKQKTPKQAADEVDSCDAQEGEKDPKQPKGSEILSKLPLVKGTKVEALLTAAFIQGAENPRELKRFSRNAKNNALRLQRVLGHAALTNKNDCWELLVDYKAGLDFFASLKEKNKMLPEDKRIAPNTLLTHVKTLEKCTRLAKSWIADPEFPEDKDAYRARLDVANAEFTKLKQEYTKAVSKDKQMKKDKFVAKGLPNTNDIRLYFDGKNQQEKISEELDWLEKYAQENNNVIKLGSGRSYDRKLAHSWNIVLRFLASKLTSITKRSSAIQGITISEFEQRTRTDGGWQVIVQEHKNAECGSDSFVISDMQIELWKKFYELRKLCQKKDPWDDKHQMLINVCGSSVTNFNVDVNKSFPNEPHKINGRTMRTATSTMSSNCSPSKTNTMMPFMNHRPDTDAVHYDCLTADDTRRGQDAVIQVQQNYAAKKAALENLDQFRNFSPSAVFPTREECEDILIETLNVSIKKLGQQVYEKIHCAWKAANVQEMAEHLAENLPHGAFDSMWILGQLRGHEEWREERMDINCRVGLLVEQRHVSIL